MDINFLIEEGYENILEKPNGLQVGLAPFAFTIAIVYGFDETGPSHRFCYKTFTNAFNAMQRWNGKGEPEGWHRALVIGQPERKISKGRLLTRNKDGYMIDKAGEVVVIY